MLMASAILSMHHAAQPFFLSGRSLWARLSLSMRIAHTSRVLADEVVSGSLSSSWNQEKLVVNPCIRDEMGACEEQTVAQKQSFLSQVTGLGFPSRLDSYCTALRVPVCPDAQADPCTRKEE